MKYTILPILLLTGCAAKMPPIVKGPVHEVSVAAEGLQKHVIFLDDTLMIIIYSGDVKMADINRAEDIGLYRLTADEPKGNLLLDSTQNYLIHFYSVAPGYPSPSTCGILAYIPANASKLIYSLQGRTCELNILDSKDKILEK
jgi:hypothetical protein